MFGKLLKYDFRSMLKQFAFIWPAALALALVNRFTLDGMDSTSTVGETTAGIAMLVYIAILMAMFIIALIFIIQRFYKGLLGDEGYLMHTLPVHSWELIGSKLLCAVVTTIVSVLVALLSILLIVPWSKQDFQEVFRVLKFLFSHWSSEVTHMVLMIVEIILFLLVTFALGYLQLYLSMGVGHLFNKNRVAMSVVAYIGIQVVRGNVFLRFWSWVMDFLNLQVVTESLSEVTRVHQFLWMAIVSELICCAIFFAGTNYILSRKLNLE